jgi:hypothetical protein
MMRRPHAPPRLPPSQPGVREGPGGGEQQHLSPRPSSVLNDRSMQMMFQWKPNGGQVMQVQLCTGHTLVNDSVAHNLSQA